MTIDERREHTESAYCEALEAVAYANESGDSIEYIDALKALKNVHAWIANYVFHVNLDLDSQVATLHNSLREIV